MTGPELIAFSSAVLSAYPLQPNLVALLTRLDRAFNRLAPIYPGVTYEDQVNEVMAKANSAGWIAELVKEVRQDRSQNAEVQSFFASYPHWSRRQATAHPCDALVLEGGHTFIGRHDFRKYLKAMDDDPTGRKVLVVTSEKRSVGKTHSSALVQHLAMSRPPAKLIFIDLDRDDYDPGKLAKRIAGDLGLMTGAPTQGLEQFTRWNQELVSWLVPAIPPATIWWIVLDGFRTRVSSEPIQDFIIQLALRVQRTSTHRLLLLNFPFRLPLGLLRYKDIVCPLAESDLRQFLEAFHLDKFDAPPSKEEVDTYVAGFDKRRREYEVEYPTEVENHALLNHAMSDVIEAI